MAKPKPIARFVARDKRVGGELRCEDCRNVLTYERDKKFYLDYDIYGFTDPDTGLETYWHVHHTPRHVRSMT